MNLFPQEIWFSVARYVPLSDLFPARTIHHALHDVANAIAFRCLTIARWDDQTEKKLKEIGTSHVKDMVHEIRLNTGVVISPKPPAAPVPVKKRGSVLARDRGGHQRRRRSGEVHPQERCRYFLQVIGELLPCLARLTRFHLEWDEDQSTIEQDMVAVYILTKVLPDRTLLTRLQVLSLKLPPDKLARLAPLSFPQLDEFKCHFITAEMESQQISQLLDGFVLFVNNLFRSLRSLSFTSTVSSWFFDLSPLFKNLGNFGHLSAFALSIPYDGCHLSNPTELYNFLQRHSSKLTKISLRAQRIAQPRTPLSDDSKVWMQGAVEWIGAEGTWELDTLELALRPLKADLQPLAQCLSRLGPQLKSLTLTDRSLICGEVDLLLNALVAQASSGRQPLPLQRLGIRVARLTPQLLDMLASKLPDLHALELTYLEIKESEQVSHIYYPSSDHLERFLSKMRTKRYPSWKLAEIGLNDCPGGRFAWLDEVERQLVECIPGLSVNEIMLSLTD